MKKIIITLSFSLFSIYFLNAQKSETIIKPKDYIVYANKVPFLKNTCGGFDYTPCTFMSIEGDRKIFTVVPYHPTQSNSYREYRFIESGISFYSLQYQVVIFQKLYDAKIINEKGDVNIDLLKLFVIENGENKPNY